MLSEERQVLSSFDPGEAGFATATEKTFDVVVDDGSLSIDLRYVPTARNKDPDISGIEILRVQNGAENPLPPSPDPKVDTP